MTEQKFYSDPIVERVRNKLLYRGRPDIESVRFLTYTSFIDSMKRLQSELIDAVLGLEKSIVEAESNLGGE